MDSLTTFLKVAKERGYQNDEYRQAKSGPKMMNWMINLVTIFLMSGLIYFVLGFIRPADPIVLDTGPKTEEVAKTTEVQQTTADPTLSPIMQKAMEWLNSQKDGTGDFDLQKTGMDVARGTVDVSKTILEVITKSSVFVFMTILVIYLFKLVLRWRHYERDVIGNDFEAALLKRRILGSLNISQQYKNAVKAASGENNQDDPTRQGKVEALRTFKNMQVHINTRQSLSGFTIVKNSRISFEVPTNQFAIDELEKLMKNVSDVATQRTNARSKFGALEISEDRSVWSVSSQTPVKDKYYFEDPNANKDDGDYESSFGIENFKDNTQKINEIKEIKKDLNGKIQSVCKSYFCCDGYILNISEISSNIY